jgi:hypothetical protein
VKKLQGLAFGTLVMLGATSTAWAAGNVAPQPASDAAIEEIVITAKRLPPEAIEEIVITAKRPAKTDQPRTPPVMAIEMPSLEFAVTAPPVVRL